MDGNDLHRRVGGARRRAQERDSIEAMRRNHAPQNTTSAEDCLKAGRDPERKFEDMRRGQGEESTPH